MKKEEKKPKAPPRYCEAVGRRKTAVCRLRLYEKTKGLTVNNKPLEQYFRAPELQKIALKPLEISKPKASLSFTALIRGGGIHSQAEALRHGLAKALVLYDANLRGELKTMGFLKRDPRMKERRKFGLKKARKAPQWSKR